MQRRLLDDQLSLFNTISQCGRRTDRQNC